MQDECKQRIVSWIAVIVFRRCSLMRMFTVQCVGRTRALQISRENCNKWVIMSITLLACCVARSMRNGVLPRTRCTLAMIIIRLPAFVVCVACACTWQFCTSKQIGRLKLSNQFAFFELTTVWRKKKGILCSGSKQRMTKNNIRYFIHIKIIIFIAVIARASAFFLSQRKNSIATRMSEDSMTVELNACNYAWKSSKEKEGKEKNTKNCRDGLNKTKIKERLWMNKWWITLMRMFCCLIKIGSSSNDHLKLSRQNERDEKTNDDLLWKEKPSLQSKNCSCLTISFGILFSE